MLKLMEEGSKVMSGLLGRSNGDGGPYSMASELTEAGKLFSEIAQHWMTDPARLVETQGALVRDYLQLVGATTQRTMGAEVLPVAEPEPETTASRTRSGAAIPTSISGSRLTSSPRAGWSRS